MRLASALALSCAIAVGALAPSMPRLLGQAAPAQSAPAGQQGGGGNLANDLVGALKATKGCIGVEVAQTQSRKQCIFAWFEDKKSTLEWYWSTYHQNAIAGIEKAAEQAKAAAAGAKDGAAKEDDKSEDHEPLQYVKDDCGPILCIATITPVAPGQKQMVPGFAAPISQISIELYTPLPGGIAFNGKFSPAELKVPHMQVIAPPPTTAAPPVK